MKKRYIVVLIVMIVCILSTIKFTYGRFTYESEVTGTVTTTSRNPFENGTLAYSIVDNAMKAEDNTDKTIYSEEPLTKPAEQINEETERTLSVTEDDLGNSYYYRGNVLDNYIDFNNMCWRIVRIEGDGSVKLILEDKTSICKTATGGDNASIGAVSYGYTGDGTSDSLYRADYENGETKQKLDEWINNFDKRLLKEDNWCIGEFVEDKNKTDIAIKIESNNIDLKCSKTIKSYSSLLSAIEFVYAGGKNQTENYNIYINNGLIYWNLLNLYRRYDTYDFIYHTGQTGRLDANEIRNARQVRPSIVLKKDIKLLSGDGTKTNAYKIDENPYEENTLAYEIVKNAQDVKNGETTTNTTKLSSVPETVPAQEASKEDERTLSITDDDYGSSYYYRGNVDDNYLNFNNMCWRIVRIEGDNSIKLILYDKDNTCKDATGGDNASIGEVSYGYTGDGTSESPYRADYENGETKKLLDEWISKFDKNLLKEENWCLEKTEVWYDNNGNISTNYEESLSTETYKRLYGLGNNIKKSTLICNNASDKKDVIGLLTADEVTFAGYLYKDSNKAYNGYLELNLKDKAWWLLTQNYRDNSRDDVFVIRPNYLGTNVVNVNFIVRPSIVLNKDIKIKSGNGLKTNPYQIE